MRFVVPLAVCWLLASLVGFSAAAEPLKLEAVVSLMRHGVRPPTKAQPMPEGVAADPWPTWPVEAGYLTPHGAKGISAIGVYERAAYAARGLMSDRGCPAPSTVAIWADVDERTIKSAQAWAEGFAPGCGLNVGHGEGKLDPLFSPVEGGATVLDSAKALAAVADHLPAGGIAGVAAGRRPELERLNRILGCCGPPICAKYAAPSPCGLGDLQSGLTASASGRPRLTGPLDLGSTAAEILMLEYVEGKPLAEVGWGRAGRADIEAVLALHPLEYAVLVRTPAIASANATPLARRMLAALDPANAAKVTILLGHDTNIASLGALLDLHWRVDSFPADDPPPGGALGFERLSDERGKAYVRIFFQAQTMDQLRTLTPLSPSAPPFRQYLAIPACETTTADACPLDRFTALVRARLTGP